MKRIVFVCTGNTCRSPMAEGLLKKELEDHNIDDVSVESVGVSTADGLPASENAVMAMKETGIDISAHRSKQITKEIVERADLVFCMTERHRRAIFSAGNYKNVYVMPNEIPDPYGGDLNLYWASRDAIAKQIPDILDRVRSL